MTTGVQCPADESCRCPAPPDGRPCLEHQQPVRAQRLAKSGTLTGLVLAQLAGRDREAGR